MFWPYNDKMYAQSLSKVLELIFEIVLSIYCSHFLNAHIDSILAKNDENGTQKLLGVL